jgi:hypothetical protein
VDVMLGVSIDLGMGGQPVRVDLRGWNEKLLQLYAPGLEIEDFRSEVVKAFLWILGFEDDFFQSTPSFDGKKMALGIVVGLRGFGMGKSRDGGQKLRVDPLFTHSLGITLKLFHSISVVGIVGFLGIATAFVGATKRFPHVARVFDMVVSIF